MSKSVPHLADSEIIAEERITTSPRLSDHLWMVCPLPQYSPEMGIVGVEMPTSSTSIVLKTARYESGGERG
jgi:hypothetical protein